MQKNRGIFFPKLNTELFCITRIRKHFRHSWCRELYQSRFRSLQCCFEILQLASSAGKAPGPACGHHCVWALLHLTSLAKAGGRVMTIRVVPLTLTVMLMGGGREVLSDFCPCRVNSHTCSDFQDPAPTPRVHWDPRPPFFSKSLSSSSSCLHLEHLTFTSYLGCPVLPPGGPLCIGPSPFPISSTLSSPGHLFRTVSPPSLPGLTF